MFQEKHIPIYFHKEEYKSQPTLLILNTLQKLISDISYYCNPFLLVISFE